MSASKKRRAAEANGGTGGRRAERAGFLSLLRGALTGAATAAVAMVVLSLIFAAAGLRSGDPARLAPIFGAAALALSSAAAGAVCVRVGGTSALVCAALGAGIAAAAMLMSLIPALPETGLIMPKAVCAAIPLAGATAGGWIATPRGRRRRRRR